MSYLNEFVQRIQKNDYSGYLTLWEEYCNSDVLDADELCLILEATRRSDMGAHLGRQLEKILPLWETLTDEKKAFQVLKLLVDLQYAPSEVIQELSFKEVEKRFAQAPRFQEKLKIAGFKNRDKIQGCIRNFELLSHFEKGNFLFHSSGWGVGEIMDVSFLREELSIDFEMLSGLKTVSFSTAFKTLEPISKEHILTQRFAQPDLLEAKAKKEPVKVIKQLLQELGPKTASEIKDELCDLVIPQDEWTKWWQQTRAKLKKDSLIDCPDDLKTPFRLRKEEVTYDERLTKALNGCKNQEETINVLYAFFRDFPDALKNNQTVSFAESKLMQIMENADTTTAELLCCLFGLEDMGIKEIKGKLQELVKKELDFVPLVSDVQVIAYKKRLLQEIKQLRNDWKMLFELFLFHVDYNPLRDYVYTELLAEGASKEVDLFIQKVINHPSDTPDAFLWLFAKAETDEVFSQKHLLKPAQLFESLLILLARLDQSSLNRNMVKKIVAMIMDDRFALVRKMMKKATVQEVKEFILLSTKCQSLTEHEVKIFQSLAEVAHPSLSKKSKEESIFDDPNVIFCTNEGYLKIQQRVQHIATVETVENAKEIEVARGHGDLRENAEFKAALERRDRLQGEMKTLSDQLSLARILSKEDISTEVVSVGCVVDCINSLGKKITYTILGPWEADVDHHILSYQSKLAQGMLKKAKGDNFSFNNDTLTIADIRSYLG